MEKIAMSDVSREGDLEAKTETHKFGLILTRLLMVLCIGVFIAALLTLQPWAEIYRLNQKVDRLEQEIQELVLSLSGQFMQEPDVQYRAVGRWEGHGIMDQPLPSPDQSESNLKDVFETSKTDDDINNENSVESSKLAHQRRRTKRSLEHFDSDSTSQTANGRQRLNSGRTHRVAAPASQATAANNDNQRRHGHRHNEVSAYQLTMDVQLYGNDRVRFQHGDTVNVTYGEYGPQGFRPNADAVASDTHVSKSPRYPYKMWKVADWAQASQTFRYNSEKGQIVVTKKGTYFIYAQLLYCNAAARSSYSVMSNEAEPLELARCWTSVDMVSGQPSTNDTATPRFKTCHVGITALLNANQQVWLEDLYGNYIKPDANANVFGIIRLAEHF